MIIDTLKNNIQNMFKKQQKAGYSLSAAGNKELGQDIPRQYPPEIREKIYKTPIVFAAVNTIADEVAKVDWEIVPKKTVLEMFGYGSEEGKSLSVMSRKNWTKFKTKYSGTDRDNLSTDTKEHIEKVYSLLEDPNENQETFTSIRKKLAIDLKLHDAAALEKTFNGVGEVTEIYTAPAPYIRLNYDKNGKLLDPAFIQYDPKMPQSKVAEWNKDELIYLMLNPISTSMYGVSPLDVIAQTVATLVNALNYNGSYFESAALPEGYFTLPGLSETAAKRLMQKWEQEIKSKAHKVVFMPEGANFHQFRFTNSEMQWLQGQKFYMEIVMAVLGVTKHELGFTEGVNRATADNQSFVFKNKSLIPMLNLFAEQFNKEIIGKGGFGYTDVMFVFKNVDLADKETMDKIHDRAVKSGRMTINEAREEAGKIPYSKVGDEPVVATSQGLVYLRQFDMQFQEYKEEEEWIKERAAEEGIPAAEYRRRLKTNQVNNVPGSQDQSGNVENQPKTPPSAPKADETPEVDESQKDATSAIMVEGLSELAKVIKDSIKEE